MSAPQSEANSPLLGGFLFGNVDDKGHLDSEAFDLETRHYIENLTANPELAQKLLHDEDSSQSGAPHRGPRDHARKRYPMVQPMADAVDYAAINEAIEDDDDATMIDFDSVPEEPGSSIPDLFEEEKMIDFDIIEEDGEERTVASKESVPVIPFPSRAVDLNKSLNKTFEDLQSLHFEDKKKDTRRPLKRSKDNKRDKQARKLHSFKKFPLKEWTRPGQHTIKPTPLYQQKYHFQHFIARHNSARRLSLALQLLRVFNQTNINASFGPIPPPFNTICSAYDQNLLEGGPILKHTEVFVPAVPIRTGRKGRKIQVLKKPVPHENDERASFHETKPKPFAGHFVETLVNEHIKIYVNKMNSFPSLSEQQKKHLSALVDEYDFASLTIYPWEDHILWEGGQPTSFPQEKLKPDVVIPSPPTPTPTPTPTRRKRRRRDGAAPNAPVKEEIKVNLAHTPFRYINTEFFSCDPWLDSINWEGAATELPSVGGKRPRPNDQTTSHFILDLNDPIQAVHLFSAVPTLIKGVQDSLPVMEKDAEQQPKDIIKVAEEDDALEAKNYQKLRAISKNDAISEFLSLRNKKFRNFNYLLVDDKIIKENKKHGNIFETNVYNLSHDDAYRKNVVVHSTLQRVSKPNIVHSLCSTRLLYYPTSFTLPQLRRFHHPTLFPTTTIANVKPYNLRLISDINARHLRRWEAKAKKHQRKKIRNPSDFIPRRKADMSLSQENEDFILPSPGSIHGTTSQPKQSSFLLVEYLEEKAPLVSNFGMGAKVRNYFRKVIGDNEKTKEVIASQPYGETVVLKDRDESPFLGDISPGHCVSSLDNNMFKAPIRRHTPPQTDFLLVRSVHNPDNWVIRDLKHLCLAGQTIPLMESYAPNSRAAGAFLKNRLKVFIYRNFKKQRFRGQSCCISLHQLQEKFPSQSVTALKNRMKDIAEFQRTTEEGNVYYLLQNDVALPSEEELNNMVLPEHIVCYESLLQGQQYLYDSGVTRFLHPSSVQTAMTGILNDERIKRSIELEDVLNITPWTSTANFISATKGKSRLKLKGFEKTAFNEMTDNMDVPVEMYEFQFRPHKHDTEGKMSLMEKRLEKKQRILKEKEREMERKREKEKEIEKEKEKEKEIERENEKTEEEKVVTGTDADLRKLSLHDARRILKKFDVSDEQINSMSRWDLIAMVRQKSSEAACGVTPGKADEGLKFARTTRPFSTEHQLNLLRNQCQMIFERQLQLINSEQELLPFSYSDAKHSPQENDKDDIEDFGAELESMMVAAGDVKKKNQDVHAVVSEEVEEEKEKNEFEQFMIEERLKKKERKKGFPLCLKKTVTDRITGHQRVEIIDSPDEIRKILQARREIQRRRELDKDEPLLKPIFMTPEGGTSISSQLVRSEKIRLQEQLRHLKGQTTKDHAERIGYSGAKRGRKPGTSSGRTRKIPDTSMLTSPEAMATPLGKVSTPDPSIRDSEPLRLKLNFDEALLSPKTDQTVSSFPEESQLKKLLLAKYRKVASGSVETNMSMVLDAILAELSHHPYAFPFLHNIDPKKSQAYDYYDFIQEPIDFDRIRENIRAHLYYSREDFLGDIHLLNENCDFYFRMGKYGSQYLPPMADVLLEHAYLLVSEVSDELTLFERSLATKKQVFLKKNRKKYEDEKKRIAKNIKINRKRKRKTAEETSIFASRYEKISSDLYPLQLPFLRMTIVTPEDLLLRKQEEIRKNTIREKRRNDRKRLAHLEKIDKMYEINEQEPSFMLAQNRKICNKRDISPLPGPVPIRIPVSIPVSKSIRTVPAPVSELKLETKPKKSTPPLKLKLTVNPPPVSKRSFPQEQIKAMHAKIKDLQKMIEQKEQQKRSETQQESPKLKLNIKSPPNPLKDSFVDIEEPEFF